jgi:hypothetical protein
VPEPYLNMPLLPSEEDEMQEHAQAWVAHLAQECFAMGEDFLVGLDLYAYEWHPDEMQIVERWHDTFKSIHKEMVDCGYIKRPSFKAKPSP